MKNKRPAVFRGRHFQDEIIVLCLRWYLRYSLSYRDLEEMMAERGLSLDHSTIARWVLRYAPILSQRIRCEKRRPNRSWRVDETYVRVAGRWTYLYRAVDSEGNTIDFMLSPNRDLTAAKHFLQLALWRTCFHLDEVACYCCPERAILYATCSESCTKTNGMVTKSSLRIK